MTRNEMLTTRTYRVIFWSLMGLILFLGIVGIVSTEPVPGIG